jgi:hypothetical protein
MYKLKTQDCVMGYFQFVPTGFEGLEWGCCGL